MTSSQSPSPHVPLSSIPVSSQSASLISTRTPGRIVEPFINISARAVSTSTQSRMYARAVFTLTAVESPGISTSSSRWLANSSSMPPANSRASFISFSRRKRRETALFLGASGFECRETQNARSKTRSKQVATRREHDAIGDTQQTHPCMQGTMPRVAAAAFRPAIYLSLSRRAAGRAVLAASPRHEPPDDGADIWWLPLTYEAATAAISATSATSATSTNPGQRRQHPHQVHRDVSNAFLRHVISHYTSEPVGALQFSRTEHGKPYLGGGLVKFNMSHADGLVGGTSLHSHSVPFRPIPPTATHTPRSFFSVFFSRRLAMRGRHRPRAAGPPGAEGRQRDENRAAVLYRGGNGSHRASFGRRSSKAAVRAHVDPQRSLREGHRSRNRRPARPLLVRL